MVTSEEGGRSAYRELGQGLVLICVMLVGITDHFMDSLEIKTRILKTTTKKNTKKLICHDTPDGTNIFMANLAYDASFCAIVVFL